MTGCVFMGATTGVAAGVRKLLAWLVTMGLNMNALSCLLAQQLSQLILSSLLFAETSLCAIMHTNIQSDFNSLFDVQKVCFVGFSTPIKMDQQRFTPL